MHLCAPSRAQQFSVLVLLFTSCATAQYNQDLQLDGDELETSLSRREQSVFPIATNEFKAHRRFKRFRGSTNAEESGPGLIFDNPNLRTQERPPVSIPDRINPRPTREQILWQKIAELRERNKNRTRNPLNSQTRGNPIPVQSRPSRPNLPFTQTRPGNLPFNQGGSPLTPVHGTITVHDRNLEATFARCGQSLERCLGNRPGHSHGHQHHNSVSNRGHVGHIHNPVRPTHHVSTLSHNHNNHQHNHRPPLINFNGQQIPVWPG